MVLAGDGDLLLLHRLQQRGLGTRAGAVDLVGHQQLAEHRARNEAEGAAAVLGLFQHFGTQDVGRHQVGRKLDALGVEPQHHAQRFDQAGLGQARHADQQPVTAGQQRHQNLLDHLVLAEDDLADAFADPGEQRGRRFGVLDRRALLRRLGNRIGIAHEFRPGWNWDSAVARSRPRLPGVGPALMFAAHSRRRRMYVAPPKGARNSQSPRSLGGRPHVGVSHYGRILTGRT